MKLTKIITKLEEHVEDITDESYNSGYADGCSDGYGNGVDWERKRIIDLFTMLSQQELVSGSASKAKAYAMAAAMVDVANTDWDSITLDEEDF
jgi:hypothetical protein